MLKGGGLMKRTGILEVDALTEKLVRGLFLAAPDAQVFLVPGNNERARNLAGEYPCWTLDTYQDLIDEADVIITGGERHALHGIAGQVQLHSTQTLVSLVPGLSIAYLQKLFGHPVCVRLMLTFAAEINQSSVILTEADKEIQTLFSLLGRLTVLSDESDFDLATVHLCMTSGFYFLAEGLQCWLTGKGMADDTARQLVLNGLKDCIEYAGYHTSLNLGVLGGDISSAVPFMLHGIEVLARMQALTPWRAASDEMLSVIQQIPDDEKQ
ncbi:pyrroline-5-carboxylate reductase [Klebsiella variicola]|nr:pyrroline-5-carboxylate reductase [Klebsiella variicola]